MRMRRSALHSVLRAAVQLVLQLVGASISSSRVAICMVVYIAICVLIPIVICVAVRGASMAMRGRVRAPICVRAPTIGPAHAAGRAPRAPLCVGSTAWAGRSARRRSLAPRATSMVPPEHHHPRRRFGIAGIRSMPPLLRHHRSHSYLHLRINVYNQLRR